MHRKQPLTLATLPDNVILNIARNLPPRSNACLSLTCKAFYNAKELESIWKRGFNPKENHCGCKQRLWPPCPPLKLDNHEQYIFLQILVRDLIKTHQLCDGCQKLYRRHEITSTGQLPIRHACPQTSSVFSIETIPRYDLDFQDVQRVMNSYRSGEPQDVALQSISLHRGWKVWPRTYPWSQRIQVPRIMKLHVEPRVISDNLIIHTREHVLITEETMDVLDWGRSVVESDQPNFTVGKFVTEMVSACSHHSGFSQIIQAVDDSVAELESKHSQEPAALGMRSTLKCSECLTQATLTSYYHPGQGFEIALKTWTNLGPCEKGYEIFSEKLYLGSYNSSRSHK